jgi:hypothetical protein
MLVHFETNAAVRRSSSEVPSSDKDLILAVKAHTTAVSQAAAMVEDYK